MPPALLITGLIGSEVHAVACDDTAMTGSEPVIAWLTSLLTAPYTLTAVLDLVPELPRLFGTVLEVVEYTDVGEAPRPVITAIAPRSMVAGGDDVVLTVRGHSFTPRSQIVLNGGLEVTVFEGPTALTTMIVGATATTPGEYPVEVQTDEPGGGRSGVCLFAILEG